MKIMTVVGARPQFIKAATVSRMINTDRYAEIEEVIIHTGQHYDQNMSHCFFEELDIPTPAYNLFVGSASQGEQTGAIMTKLEEVVTRERPDWILVYGDTNSTLAGALVAAKDPVRLAHVESGLRSFHWGMAEEVNRIVTDRLSDILYCPSETAVRNLRQEGREMGVYLTGDVTYDGFLYYAQKAQHNEILQQLDLTPGQYLLVTMHRAENTSDPQRLRNIIISLQQLAAGIEIVLPLHPRTKRVAEEYSLSLEGLRIIDPVPYLAIITLLVNTKMVITDSGGLQKEAYFAKVPCITLRDETEWIETLENGWNRLVSPDDGDAIISQARLVLQLDFSDTHHLLSYGAGDAAEKILDVLLEQM